MQLALEGGMLGDGSASICYVSMFMIFTCVPAVTNLFFFNSVVLLQNNSSEKLQSKYFDRQSLVN